MARATFRDLGVLGTIEFTQASPSDPVETCIDLHDLRGQAGGLHVHELPVTQEARASGEACSATGGHFNPFNVDAKLGPAAGEGSDDEYEVGDLSGKYGSLAGMEERSECFTDTNLSLFGENSIVDRSVVIHKSLGGDRWVCANIELVGWV